MWINRELNISQYAIRQTLKNELGVKQLKISKVQDLTDAPKNRESYEPNSCFAWLKVVFSNEKPFVIQQFVNKQNDCVYLPKSSADNLHLRLATRTQAPVTGMVRAAITADGRSPLVFIDRGVKINAEYYRENILEGALKPWARKHIGHRLWTLQQDSAPSQWARATQEWLKN